MIRDGAGKGCDVLAKNDRGHTPFALCTDPEASQWCLCLLSISRSCCMLVESPCKSRLYSCIGRRSETTWVLIFSGTTALAECHECNSLQGHTRRYELFWVCRCLHCLNSGGIWKAVLLHCVEISLLLAAVFRPINWNLNLMKIDCYIPWRCTRLGDTRGWGPWMYFARRRSLKHLPTTQNGTNNRLSRATVLQHILNFSQFLPNSLWRPCKTQLLSSLCSILMPLWVQLRLYCYLPTGLWTSRSQWEGPKCSVGLIESAVFTAVCATSHIAVIHPPIVFGKRRSQWHGAMRWDCAIRDWEFDHLNLQSAPYSIHTATWSQVRATIQDLEHQLNHVRILCCPVCHHTGMNSFVSRLCSSSHSESGHTKITSIEIRNKAMHLNQLDTVTAALEAAAAGDHSYVAVQVIAAWPQECTEQVELVRNSIDTGPPSADQSKHEQSFLYVWHSLTMPSANVCWSRTSQSTASWSISATSWRTHTSAPLFGWTFVVT